MELTDEQLYVSDAIVDFATGKIEQPYIAISGYAGTGKTTVMGFSGARIKQLKPNIAIAYCAPTAKAAGVLEKKLKDFGALTPLSDVRTIHGHIYKLREKQGVNLKFDKKADIGNFDLIVVDEASMVTTQMFRDLLYYKIPIVFIGDPGQLPPVNSVPFAPLIDTEYKLTKVVRQALDNSILRVATEIRNGVDLGYFVSSDGRSGRFSENNKNIGPFLKGFAKKIPEGNSIFLTWTNKKRVACNKMIRDALGFKSDIPEIGEKVICLKNNYELGLVNGQIYTVMSSNKIVGSDTCYYMQLDDGMDVIAYERALNLEKVSGVDILLGSDSRDIYKSIKGYQSEVALFDFGYACSVHKAQGSEWDYVVLYDERSRMYQVTQQEQLQWMYTGVTRAKEKLCIVA